MSFGGSDVHSSETLGEGVAALKHQVVKQENMSDRETMEAELKD